MFVIMIREMVCQRFAFQDSPTHDFVYLHDVNTEWTLAGTNTLFNIIQRQADLIARFARLDHACNTFMTLY